MVVVVVVKLPQNSYIQISEKKLPEIITVLMALSSCSFIQVLWHTATSNNKSTPQ